MVQMITVSMKGPTWQQTQRERAHRFGSGVNHGRTAQAGFVGKSCSRHTCHEHTESSTKQSVAEKAICTMRTNDRTAEILARITTKEANT